MECSSSVQDGRPGSQYREGGYLEAHRPGMTVLLSVRENEVRELCGHVALLDLTSMPTDQTPSLNFNRGALEAWSAASYAVLPLLPAIPRDSSLSGALSSPRFACWLNPKRHANPDGTLDGSSYGLAFALAIASLWLDVPVPVDLAASACILPNGVLGLVEGLNEKLLSLFSDAPQVKRVLVAEGQRNIKAPPGVEIVECRSLRDAIHEAFPDIDERVRERLRSAQDRESLLRRIANDAVSPRPALASCVGRKQFMEWAAEIAEEAGQERLHEFFRFATAVQARHDGNCDERAAWDFESRDLGWIGEFRQVTTRFRTVAHLFQHHVDFGVPSAETLWGLNEVYEEIPDLQSDPSCGDALDLSACFPVHWEVLGAMARARHIEGRDDRLLCAYRWALALAKRWIEEGRADASGASFPLAHAAHLAGVCQRLGLVADAGAQPVGELHALATRYTELAQSPWILLALARGYAAAEEGDELRRVLATFDKFHSASSLEPHRLLRTRLQLIARGEMSKEEQDLFETLRSEVASEHAPCTRLHQRALLGLQLAVSEDDDRAVAYWLERCEETSYAFRSIRAARPGASSQELLHLSFY